MNDAKEYLKAITEEGKEITINIKLLDSEKAKDLLGTMYDKNLEQFGVAVQSWGFWDVQKANKLRMEAVQKELERHRQTLQELFNKHDLAFLEEAAAQRNSSDPRGV